MSRDPRAACEPTAAGRCSVCGDEAELVRVIAIDAAARAATVVTDDGSAMARTVAVDLLDRVTVGDVVLVHMGFAIARAGGTAGS